MATNEYVELQRNNKWEDQEDQCNACIYGGKCKTTKKMISLSKDKYIPYGICQAFKALADLPADFFRKPGQNPLTDYS